MVWRACRTASPVTAQVLTITASSSPAALALRAHDFGFMRVQPAAEGDDLDAHHALADRANSAGLKTPSYSNSTGPVIST